jgi:DNA-directed RNA polymerase specialized sigma24 family protein
MQYLYQKISYLRGITDGLKIDESTDEGKIFLHIIDALEEIVDTMDAIVEAQEDIEDYIAFIDEDLSDVEEELYGVDFDDDFEDFDDFDDFQFDDYMDDFEEDVVFEEDDDNEADEEDPEVFALVAEGYSNREIAKSLYLSEGTVRNYISRLLEKLNLRDRTQLAIRYLKE